MDRMIAVDFEAECWPQPYRSLALSLDEIAQNELIRGWNHFADKSNKKLEAINNQWDEAYPYIKKHEKGTLMWMEYHDFIRKKLQPVIDFMNLTEFSKVLTYEYEDEPDSAKLQGRLRIFPHGIIRMRIKG